MSMWRNLDEFRYTKVQLREQEIRKSRAEQNILIYSMNQDLYYTKWLSTFIEKGGVVK